MKKLSLLLSIILALSVISLAGDLPSGGKTCPTPAPCTASNQTEPEEPEEEPEEEGLAGQSGLLDIINDYLDKIFS